MVTLIYDPNEGNDWEFWEEGDTPWILGGDFNIVQYEIERWGRDRNICKRVQFNEVINMMGLIELPILGGYLLGQTWEKFFACQAR